MSVAVVLGFALSRNNVHTDASGTGETTTAGSIVGNTASSGGTQNPPKTDCEHVYRNGICTACGAEEPTAPEYLNFRLMDNGTYSVRGGTKIPNLPERLIIPDTYEGKPVTVIENVAFIGAKNLKYVYIPDSVTEIGKQAFFECKNLEDVVLPESLKKIGGQSFASCEALREITVKGETPVLGEAVFSGCTSLKKAVIECDWQSEYNSFSYVFFECKSLETVEFRGKIVSNIAGTTRDAIDTSVDNEFGRYTFIDTAGIRRQSKVEDRVEKFSVLRAKLAVERADVCVIMIDAEQGVTEQDEKIAGLAHEAGKASIIVLNKWDLIEKDNKTVKQFTDDIRTTLGFMPYAPILFASAKTGQRVERLFEMINSVHEQSTKRITTGMLNDVLNDAMTRVQPPTDKGKRLKIYYMTQTSIAPPTFVIFCNSEELFHFSYQRYLENCLRDTFGFTGTPIKLVVRQKGDDSTSV
jgi:small GTP-binding protein